MPPFLPHKVVGSSIVEIIMANHSMCLITLFAELVRS